MSSGWWMEGTSCRDEKYGGQKRRCRVVCPGWSVIQRSRYGWRLRIEIRAAARSEVSNRDIKAADGKRGAEGSTYFSGLPADQILSWPTWMNPMSYPSALCMVSMTTTSKDILMIGILEVMVPIFMVVQMVAWYHDQCNLDSDGGGDVCHLDGGLSGCILWRRRSTRSVPSWVSIITAAKGQPLINMQVLRVRTRQCSLVAYCHKNCEHLHGI